MLSLTPDIAMSAHFGASMPIAYESRQAADDEASEGLSLRLIWPGGNDAARNQSKAKQTAKYVRLYEER